MGPVSPVPIYALPANQSQPLADLNAIGRGFEEPNVTSVVLNTSTRGFIRTNFTSGRFNTSTGGLISMNLTSGASNILTDEFDDILTPLNTTLMDPSTPTPQGRLLSEGIPRDYVRSGQYRIWQCNSNQTNSGASQILTLLSLIHINLAKVIAEAQHNGTRSPYGFGALFKTNASIAVITDLYEKIAAGAPVPVLHASGYQGRPLGPALICATNATNGFVRGYYNHCVRRPRRIAAWARGTPKVALCTRFFNLSMSPVPADCPDMSSGEIPISRRLQMNMEAALVHEVTHVYLGTTQIGTEMYDLDTAAGLGVQRSVVNPSNLAFFYACESRSLKNLQFFLTPPSSRVGLSRLA